MSNYDNMKGLQSAFEPSYNSDQELSEDEKNQIYTAPMDERQQVRDQIWSQKPAVDRYSRLVKKFIQGGDKADEQ